MARFVDTFPGRGTQDPRATRAGSERGASILEFAVVLPVLVLLLIGSIEFGMAMFRLQGVHAASRDAARVGSYPTTTAAQIEARAEASLASVALAMAPTVSITPNSDYPCAGADDAVVVEVSVDDHIFVPFWGNVTIPLTSRSEFACEH